jgi:hypothetical protein
MEAVTQPTFSTGWSCLGPTFTPFPKYSRFVCSLLIIWLANSVSDATMPVLGAKNSSAKAVKIRPSKGGFSLFTHSLSVNEAPHQIV